MGTCSSCAATNSSAAAAVTDAGGSTSLRPCTARVIDLQGSLAEFRGAVTASQALLASSAAPSSSAAPCFLCSSDSLFVDASIPAVGHDEPLRPGQIYFALPVSMLHRPLSVSDMAALATRASSAFSVDEEQEDDTPVEQQQQRPRLRVFRVRPVAAEVDEATCEVLNENINALASYAVLPAPPPPPPPSLVKMMMKKKKRPSSLHVPVRSMKSNLTTIQEAGE